MLRGSGAMQADVAFQRHFHFTEKIGLRFRAEFFNIFNHPNFGNPNNDLTSPLFGGHAGEQPRLRRPRQKPQYTFQAKLSIPLIFGVDLPIVYQYANRAAQINQSNSEARLGLSIDLSRLAQAFKTAIGLKKVLSTELRLGRVLCAGESQQRFSWLSWLPELFTAYDQRPERPQSL